MVGASSRRVTVGSPDLPLRVAILQRVCPHYRVPLFRRLAGRPGLQVRVLIGDDVPGTKVRSAADLRDVPHERLPTRFVRVAGRLLPWHKGLRRALTAFDPHAILCEGESNLLNYLQALAHRARHPGVALVHWGGGRLPGEAARGGMEGRVVRALQRRFDAYLVYSTFQKESLVASGLPPERIVVAVNVADTRAMAAEADALGIDRAAARRKLGLPDGFTLLYVGELARVKRPDLLLELARRSPEVRCVLLGDGEMLAELRARVASEGLGERVRLPGRVRDELPLYLRAGDAVIVPGRGGIVISEAMAWSLPVLVHEADGTEVDLVEDGRTGFLVPRGDADAFLAPVERLRRDPALAERMGRAAREAATARFTTDAMIEAIEEAVALARRERVARRGGRA